MQPRLKFVELDKQLHDRKSFDCGRQALNDFLQKNAVRHRAAGVSLTMVLPAEDPEGSICAFYTLSHTEIKRQTLPNSLSKKLPHYPIPVILLAQLGVSKAAQGAGLGKITLVKALEHVYRINRHLPSYAVVVDALYKEVEGFYIQYGFELLDLEDDKRRFFLPMKRLERLFGDGPAVNPNPAP